MYITIQASVTQPLSPNIAVYIFSLQPWIYVTSVQYYLLAGKIHASHL